ncbi:MAG: hypothetical protein ACO3JG_09445 [Luteolibacter sp.]
MKSGTERPDSGRLPMEVSQTVRFEMPSHFVEEVQGSNPQITDKITDRFLTNFGQSTGDWRANMRHLPNRDLQESL